MPGDLSGRAGRARPALTRESAPPIREAPDVTEWLSRPADGSHSRGPGGFSLSPHLGDDGPQGRRQLPDPGTRRRPGLAIRDQASGLPTDRAFDQPAGAADAARDRAREIQPPRPALARPDHLRRSAQRAPVPVDPGACRQARPPRARRRALGADRELRSRGHHAAVPPAQAAERAAQHRALAAGRRSAPARCREHLGAAPRPPAPAVYRRHGRRQRRAVRAGPGGRDAAGARGERVRQGSGRVAADQHQRAHAQAGDFGARGGARQSR